MWKQKLVNLCHGASRPGRGSKTQETWVFLQLTRCVDLILKSRYCETQAIRGQGKWPGHVLPHTYPNIQVNFTNDAAAIVQVQAQLVQTESLLQKVAQVVLQEVPTGPFLYWARPGEEPPRHRARADGERELRGGGTRDQSCITDSNPLGSVWKWECNNTSVLGWTRGGETVQLPVLFHQNPPALRF